MLPENKTIYTALDNGKNICIKITFLFVFFLTCNFFCSKQPDMRNVKEMGKIKFYSNVSAYLRVSMSSIYWGLKVVWKIWSTKQVKRFWVKNMRHILRLYWYFEDPQKSPPTFSYLAPKLAIIFVVTENLVSYCSLGAKIVVRHLQ